VGSKEFDAIVNFCAERFGSSLKYFSEYHACFRIQIRVYFVPDITLYIIYYRYYGCYWQLREI